VLVNKKASASGDFISEARWPPDFCKHATGVLV